MPTGHLSLSSNPGGGLGDILGRLLLGLLGFVVLGCSFLDSCLLLLLSSSDSLLPLGFTNLRLLVPLGHDVLKSGSNNSPLELLGPFLLDIFLESLLVFPTVQHSPGDFTRVPLEQVSLVGPALQELVALAIRLDESSPMAGINLIAGVNTQVDLHD